MGLFGKKKRKKEYDISDMDMQEILSSDDVSDQMFDSVERSQYVGIQCEQIIESSKYIEDARKEYASVTEYLNDIQILDQLEEEPRKLIAETAEDMFGLNHDRVESRRRKMRLPASKYNYYSMHEDELPDALKRMQNDEQYFQMIRNDLNVLEAEKTGLKDDIENCVNRRSNVRNISIIGVIVVIAVFMVLALMGKIVPDADNYILTVVLFFISEFVVFMFVLDRIAVYTIQLS